MRKNNQTTWINLENPYFEGSQLRENRSCQQWQEVKKKSELGRDQISAGLLRGVTLPVLRETHFSSYIVISLMHVLNVQILTGFSC